MKSAFTKLFWAVDRFIVIIFKLIWVLFAIAIFLSFHAGLIFLAFQWSGGSVAAGLFIWLVLFWIVGGLFHYIVFALFGRRNY